MTHDPPTLLELAARVVKTIEIPYTENDLPITLIEYLNSGHKCVNPRCQGMSWQHTYTNPDIQFYNFYNFFILKVFSLTIEWNM